MADRHHEGEVEKEPDAEDTVQSASKYKRYYLASVIARKVELKAMAPTHCSFSVSGNSFENLIGISPEIIAYGYHRGINECYADGFRSARPGKCGGI